jgi:hypothetical protein
VPGGEGLLCLRRVSDDGPLRQCDEAPGPSSESLLPSTRRRSALQLGGRRRKLREHQPAEQLPLKGSVFGKTRASRAQPFGRAVAPNGSSVEILAHSRYSPLEGSGFELSVPLPQTTPSTSPCRALHPTPAFSPAEPGAARFGGGDGSKDLLWGAHQGRGLTMQYSFRHRMRPTELRKD